MGAYRETHEDMAREAETRASFYRTLASLYFKELDQAGIDALSNEDLTATGVDDELMEEGYADMAAYLKHRDGGTRQELATDSRAPFWRRGRMTTAGRRRTRAYSRQRVVF